MSMQIRQIHPHFVGEVRGVDLGQPVDAALIREIWAAIDRYAVLVFHDQRLSDAQLRNFAGNFGKLEIGRAAAEAGKRRLALPEIGDISNLDEEGQLRRRDDRRRLDSLGNRLWHTDASYMSVPVVLGMLYAVAVPPPGPLGGGETEFADMRAAYAGRHRRAGCRARHLLVARPDRLHRFFAKRAGEISAFTAAAGATPSRIAAQDPLFVGPRLAHRRLAGARGPVASLRSHPARNPTGIRLQPQMAGG
jgi:Taurine catabolism dioxygenase TauD, TfdA family